MPNWERRHIPDQQLRRRSVNQGDSATELSISATPSRRLPDAGWRRATTRSPSSPSHIAPSHPGWPASTSPSGHRPRQPARPRGGAEEGARRNRTQLIASSWRIDPRRAIAMLLALALVELLLPPLAGFLRSDVAMRISAGTGCCCRSSLGLIVGRRAGSTGFLSVALPAGAGLKANKSSAEASGTGLLRSATGRRPVRRLDRPHHLHRHRLRADGSRPHRRSRLRARGHHPGRQSQPAPADRTH